MQEQEKRRPGRPRKTGRVATVPLRLDFPEELLERIDARTDNRTQWFIKAAEKQLTQEGKIMKQQMKWNSDKWAYFGVTSDGKGIRVEGDEIAESAQDVGIDTAELSRRSVFTAWDELSDAEKELLDPDTWAGCIGANQNVEYVS